MQYFIEVRADDDEEFERIGEVGADLFTGSASRERRTIEGLATMAQIERLVQRGYRVTIEEPADRRSRARDIIDFDAWLDEVR